MYNLLDEKKLVSKNKKKCSMLQNQNKTLKVELKSYSRFHLAVIQSSVYNIF